jgi:hypothetical protein
MGMGEPLNNYDALVGALQGLREVLGMRATPNPTPNPNPNPNPNPTP